MPAPTFARFVGQVEASGLLPPAALPEFRAWARGADPDVAALARRLARRGLATPYQLCRLYRGEGDRLRLGPYLLLDRLGAGAMGEVLLARHAPMNRLVAVKRLRRGALARPSARARFEREARAAARLDHPHVVHAFDAGYDAGRPYLVMEYVAGTDLRRRLDAGGPLPAADACAYARQAALGLGHAWGRGVLHRDVKPSNLLLEMPRGAVKLADFGLARLGGEDDALTRPGAALGTVDYLAPEAARGLRRWDVRSDLYALGCTLYHLLAGRVPFPGSLPLGTLLRHLREEPAPLEGLRPGLPPGLAAAVRRLMAKDPAARYQDPAEAAEALGGLLGGGDLGPPAAAPGLAPPRGRGREG